MNETPDEIAALQELLDASAGKRSRHLTDIVSADRRLLAERLCADLVGVLVLNVATVTASGEPRLSAVDGHFRHGRWVFSTASSAAKARHLTARPAISAGYAPRDGYGVWTHGRAVALEGDEYRRMDAHLSEIYDMPLQDMADGIAIFRIEPTWMIGYAMTEDEMAEFEASVPARERRLTEALERLG